MPVTPSENFLTSKAGPLPVWGWGAVGLGAAYAYSRYRAGKSAQASASTATSATGAAGEPVSGQPTYVIENNIPGVYGSPTQPVTTPGTPAPPVVTPPGTNPTPPVTPPVTPPHPVDFPPVHMPGGGVPVHAPTPTPRSPVTYRVVAGDSLSKIAAQYKVPGGWQALFAYNTDPKNNAAAATFKRQGPNLLYAGQTIHIPQ